MLPGKAPQTHGAPEYAMTRRLGPLVFVLACGLLATSLPARALGPLDVELGAYWWQNDVDAQGIEEDDGAAPAAWARLWFGKWGVRGGYAKGDADPWEMELVHVDVVRKIVAPTEQNYLALGIGWGRISIGPGGDGADLDGVRLVADARANVAGIVFVYGEAAWSPWLGDPDGERGTFWYGEDAKGYEYELGVELKIFPSTRLRAGYRLSRVEYDAVPRSGNPVGITQETSGFLAGVSFKF